MPYGMSNKNWMYQKMSGDTFAASLCVKACEMAWYAHNAGAQSRVTELMYKPRASTGFYAQHLERALGLDYDAESLYSVRMAAQDKYDQNRTDMDLAVHRPSS